jgi:hypothetical protein
MRVRVALSVGVLLAVSGGLGFLLAEHAAPGAGQSVLLVNLFAAVASVTLTLWLTARYEAGIRRIASGLSEVARGRRDLRFDVGREPLVSGLAHAANEALSALEAPIDPSVGPVRVRKRTGSSPDVRLPDAALPEPPHSNPRLTPVPTPAPVSAAVPAPASASAPKSALNPGVDPAGLGAVTVPAPPPPRAATLPPPPATPPPPARKSKPPSSPPASAAADDDDLPPLPPPPANLSTVPPAARSNLSHRPSQVPTVLPPAPMPPDTGEKKEPSDAQMKMEHYRAVFEEYRAGLTRMSLTDGMMTMDEFTETLTATERSLVERHGCRSVRFSVLVEDGQVQLLPRLVR